MSHELEIKFVDESASFTHGFECGVFYQMSKDNNPPCNHLAHVICLPQIKLIAQRFGYALSVDVYDDEWCYITFSKSKPTLKVVK